MRELDLAWAGGLFDGEGTTSILKAQRDRYSYLRMSVSQKDREVLDKFRAIIGYGKVYEHSRGMHSWDCYRQDQVYQVLEMLWPYISSQKRKQAENALPRVTAKTHTMEIRDTGVRYIYSKPVRSK